MSDPMHILERIGQRVLPDDLRHDLALVAKEVRALEARVKELDAAWSKQADEIVLQMLRADKAEAERDEINRSRKRFMDSIAAFQSMTGFDLENGARRLKDLEKAKAELAAALGNAVIAGAHDSATCEWCANHFGRAAGRESGRPKG